MDLRKEIQVALNNCQPNTNRVDKIEAIAQKYAEFYHALQLQQTGVSSSDYRIKEVGGKFLIQKKIITIKKTGFLWLKKEEIIEWKQIDHRGIPLFYTLFFNNYLDAIGYLDTIEEAKSKIQKLLKVPKYHYC